MIVKMERISYRGARTMRKRLVDPLGMYKRKTMLAKIPSSDSTN